MSKAKKAAKVVRLPGPMRMVWGALAAYWLRDIIHPGFTFIAVMILLMIPVLIANTLFPEKRLPESTDLANDTTDKTDE